MLLFSCSAVSDSLPPQRLLHTRLLCPSLSPEVCSNSCPLSRCHPTISSTVGCPINQSQNTGLKAPPPPCCCSAAQLFPTLCISMDCSTPGFLSFTISQNLLKLMSIELVMPFNHLIPCPLLLLPSIFSRARIFSNEWALCIRWPKYWSFSFSISLSNEHSGLISFTIYWFDFLARQGSLKSPLQHHILN